MPVREEADRDGAQPLRERRRGRRPRRACRDARDRRAARGRARAAAPRRAARAASGASRRSSGCSRCENSATAASAVAATTPRPSATAGAAPDARAARERAARRQRAECREADDAIDDDGRDGLGARRRCGARGRSRARRRRRRRSAGSARAAARSSSVSKSHQRPGSRRPRATSSRCQRTTMTNVATMLIAIAAQNQPGLDSRSALPILCRSACQSTAAIRHDREPDLQREPCGTGHRVKCACRRRTAATTSSTSESEWAGESGSESTSAPAASATGSGARRVRGAEVREVVHRQEVQARADALLAERLGVGVAVGAGLRRARCARRRCASRGRPRAPSRRPSGVMPAQAGEALVVALGLRDAPRVVLVDAVQLAERDAGVQIAEVELVAGLEHVVGARALLLVALPGVAREPVQAQRGDARRERLVGAA